MQSSTRSKRREGGKGKAAPPRDVADWLLLLSPGLFVDSNLFYLFYSVI
jgi:hypothetical protein